MPSNQAAPFNPLLNSIRVRVAATGNVTIASGLNPGDTLDGVTLAAGDLILLPAQSASEQNGIYECATVPTRLIYFNAIHEGIGGAYDRHPAQLVTVEEGTANANTVWQCTSNRGGTLDSTALAYSQMLIPFSVVSPIVFSGGVLSLNVGVDFNWTVSQTITSALPNYALALISTDDATPTSGGPGISLYRNSPTPAASDVLGFIDWYGNNSTPASFIYARQIVTLSDPTVGSEDSAVFFQNVVAGTMRTRIQFSGNEIRFRSPAVSSAMFIFDTSIADDTATGLGLFFDRNSGTPAGGDDIFIITGQGRDSGAAAQTYGQFILTLDDATAASEDASWRFRTVVAGTTGDRAIISGGVYHPSAAGTDKGNNTLNFGTIYENNHQVATRDQDNTFTAAQTITTTTSGAINLTLVNTFDDTAAAPLLALYRNSATPVAEDLLGQLTFIGQDSGGSSQTYATLVGAIVDPTAGAEAGGFSFATFLSGTNAGRMRIRQGVFHASVTGGDKGNNTINFGTIYENNHRVATIDQNNNFSAAQTFSLSTTFAIPVVIQGTNSDATAVYLQFVRDGGAGTDGDALAVITVYGKDTANNLQEFNQINFVLDDADSGTEDTTTRFTTTVAGTLASRLVIGGGVYHPSVTGTDKGNNTLNFGTIYQNDSQVLDLGDIATQPIMETGTSLVEWVPPGRQHNHPGHPKFWVKSVVTGAVPANTASYNVTSIGDTATGRMTVTIATDFSTANWMCNVSVEAASNSTAVANRRFPCIANAGQAAGTVEVNCWDGTATNSNLVDPAAWHVSGMGDQ